MPWSAEIYKMKILYCKQRMKLCFCLDYIPYKKGKKNSSTYTFEYIYSTYIEIRTRVGVFARNACGYDVTHETAKSCANYTKLHIYSMCILDVWFYPAYFRPTSKRFWNQGCLGLPYYAAHHPL